MDKINNCFCVHYPRFKKRTIRQHTNVYIAVYYYLIINIRKLLKLILTKNYCIII